MPQKQLAIFLFIDALGWEIIRQTNFMKDEFPERKPVQMQFGYSCTAIPTILSGKTPAEHGHLGLFRFSPQTSPFRRLALLQPLLKPASFWNRGRVRHWLSKAVKKLYGFTGYFQLYQVPFNKLPLMDYGEKQNLFTAHGLGQVENLCDRLSRTSLKWHISDWHLHDAQNLDIACREIADGTQFLFLYTAELDALLHDHVGKMDIICRKLDWYRERIQAVFQAAQQSGNPFSFTIFSDHGMTPLTHTADIKTAVDNSGLRFGIDYGACYDSTLCRFTYLQPQARERIHAILDAFADQGHWLSSDEEHAYGIYREDRFFGDELFLLNPGIQVVPSDMGLKPLNGMHGFAPEDPDSMAAVISTDPIPDSIRSVADYFRLMELAINNLETESSPKQQP